ncbi:hypothetical protein V1478_012978 [Vespula squamosa]|uniref:Uncharacterized protein n=1 Tax=Vespula squamosa TaxID=30214 RepID=A0ABD2A9H9_VESSQ
MIGDESTLLFYDRTRVQYRYLNVLYFLSIRNACLIFSERYRENRQDFVVTYTKEEEEKEEEKEEKEKEEEKGEGEGSRVEIFRSPFRNDSRPRLVPGL